MDFVQILENSLIKDVYAVIKNQSDGKSILMAYIISQDNNLDINQIYTTLREKLPYYMIPTIMQIDKFPLTPNGKIDNKQLPLPTKNLIQSLKMKQKKRF